MRHGEAVAGRAARTASGQNSRGPAARGAAAPMAFASRFTYLPDDLPSASPALKTQQLQEAMMLRLSNQFHSFGLSHTLEQSKIPAGYTYLAQFAVHDMLRSTPLAARAGGAVQPSTNEETAGIDLHALYGGGPGESPSLYEPSATAGKRGRLRIGHLNKARPPAFEKGAPADVPRDRAAGSFQNAPPTEPALADRRNADSLILAQLTSLFIRFHNILFEISNNAGDADPFGRARKTVVGAYRTIVWNDLIGRLTEQRIFDHYTPTLALPREPGWNVPSESAFAVLRIGHAMVREKYQLNDRFNGVSAAPNVAVLLQFFDKLSGQPLPPGTIWEIDWSRFFDMGRDNGGGFNHSAKIRPALPSALATLSTKKLALFPSAEGMLTSLAFRALMRGFLVGLPSGQAAAPAVSAKLGFGVRTLSSAQISASLTAAANDGLCAMDRNRCLSGDDIEVLSQHTPLFLYVLLEADIFGDGSKLGPVGSDFLCHAFAGGLRVPADDPDRNISTISGVGLPGTMPELLRFLEQHRSPEV